MPDITVVIPAYNAETTLERSVLSAAKQSLGLPEVIVVDDGSTDRTGEIAQKCERGGLCRVVRTERARAGGARNAGIEAAKSPYVTFLDADDALTSDACELLLRTAHKYDADVIYGSHLYVTKEGLLEPVQYMTWTREYTDGTNLRHAEPLAVGHPVVTGKAYRLDMLNRNDLRFSDLLVTEDFEFSIRAWFSASRIMVAEGDVYLRRPFVRAEGKSDRPATAPVIRDRLRAVTMVNRFAEDNELLVVQDRYVLIGLRRALQMIATIQDADEKAQMVHEFAEFVRDMVTGERRQLRIVGTTLDELESLSQNDITRARVLYWQVRSDMDTYEE